MEHHLQHFILLIYLLEGLLLGALGLALGLLGGRWVAQLMGRTRTFLDTAVIANRAVDDLVATISPNALAYAGLAVLLTLLALTGLFGCFFFPFLPRQVGQEPQIGIHRLKVAKPPLRYIVTQGADHGAGRRHAKGQAC